jgi:hypothetical protein
MESSTPPGEESWREPEPLKAAPDLSGAPVEDANGELAGTVYASLADASSGLIRYLDLALEGTDRHILVPLGHAEVSQDPEKPEVHLRAAAREELEGIPPYEPSRQALDDFYQRAVLNAHGRLFHGERYYAHPAYDHSGLYAGTHPIIRDLEAPAPPSALHPLGALPGFHIADGEPDIRGWRVLDGHGEPAGRVDELLVDGEAERVRYAVVTPEEGRGRQVAIPVGYLQIDPSAHDVHTPALTKGDLAALPPYHPGAFGRAEEERVREVLDERLDGERRFDRPDFRSR